MDNTSGLVFGKEKMAELFNHDSVKVEILPGGAKRQRLIDDTRVSGSECIFDRLVLDSGTKLEINVSETEIIWAQLLKGSAALADGKQHSKLDQQHVFFLPPKFSGTLSTTTGATCIFLKVCNALKFDPDLAATSSNAKLFDLGSEPILESKHDERTRVYVATKNLFNTTALAGELVIFPAGSMSANHHHIGAEHFQFILSGEGTVFLNETPYPLRSGDLVYKYDGERHYCHNHGDEEFTFVEFFVPGKWETIWADPERSCTWSPTGKSLQGGTASRKITAHTSDGTVYDDV
ncbi:MAG: hypothetical protein CMM56_10780 [Rhodospirillaceae bacterium]|nr:hypothetical protein [Rhodospirillaceae bacterium]